MTGIDAAFPAITCRVNDGLTVEALSSEETALVFTLLWLQSS